jgi:plastocyanin
MASNNQVSFILSIFLSSLLVLMILSHTGNQKLQNVNAMLFSDAKSFITRTSASITHRETDTSVVTAVIIISEDKQGNTVFRPQNVTIRTGEEVIILNNSTTPHSLTNGMGPDDPLLGKLFSTGTIKPESFVEYSSHNLKPGTYPSFSTANPNVKAILTVVGNN